MPPSTGRRCEEPDPMIEHSSTSPVKASWPKQGSPRLPATLRGDRLVFEETSLVGYIRLRPPNLPLACPVRIPRERVTRRSGFPSLLSDRGFSRYTSWGLRGRTRLCQHSPQPTLAQSASPLPALGKESAKRNRRVSKDPRSPATRMTGKGEMDRHEPEKRSAGQHAMGEGRKRKTLGMVAKLGASALS